MKTTDRHTKRLGVNLITYFLKTIERPIGITPILLILNILASIFCIGNDFIKVLMRKDIGITAIDFYRFIFDFIILTIVIVLISITNFDAFHDDQSVMVVSPFSSIITILILFTFNIVFLRKGHKLRKLTVESNNKNYTESNGSSSFLNFLSIKYSWSESKIENFAEPFYFILIGFAFCCFNLLGGLVLIAIGISGFIFDTCLRIIDWLEPYTIDRNKTSGFSQAKSS